MDGRLYEVAITGDENSLRKILQEEALFFDGFMHACVGKDNPLHIAAQFGHVEFVREILDKKQGLARRLNSQGLSPLHLASLKGHDRVVEVLLQKDPDVCFVRDREGRTPLHIAAMKGHVEVLKQLVDTKPKAAWFMTDRGEPILHLCVNHNQFKALDALLKWVKENDHNELLKLKDNDGNTILHLLATKDQREVIRSLLGTNTDLDVNAVNVDGFTVLDISLQHPSGHDRLKSRRILVRARAKTAKELSKPTAATPSQNKIRNLQLENYYKWLSKTKETLMVVAILMATVTFQAGMNPPGGVWQSDDYHNKTILYHLDSTTTTEKAFHRAGEAIMSSIHPTQYISFVIFNSLGFVASLSLIVLLVSGFSFQKKVSMWSLMTLIWIAVLSMLAIYACSLSVLTAKHIRSSLGWSQSPLSYGWWLVLTGILLLVRFSRLVPWLLNTLGIVRLVLWIIKLLQSLPRNISMHLTAHRDRSVEEG